MRVGLELVENVRGYVRHPRRNINERVSIDAWKPQPFRKRPHTSVARDVGSAIRQTIGRDTNHRRLVQTIELRLLVEKPIGPLPSDSTGMDRGFSQPRRGIVRRVAEADIQPGR